MRRRNRVCLSAAISALLLEGSMVLIQVRPFPLALPAGIFGLAVSAAVIAWGTRPYWPGA